MQCCGEPFEVGDDVQWTAEKWTFGDPGIPGLNEVDFYYENHSDEEISVINGKVKRCSWCIGHTNLIPQTINVTLIWERFSRRMDKRTSGKRIKVSINSRLILFV